MTLLVDKTALPLGRAYVELGGTSYIYDGSVPIFDLFDRYNLKYCIFELPTILAKPSILKCLQQYPSVRCSILMNEYDSIPGSIYDAIGDSFFRYNGTIFYDEILFSNPTPREMFKTDISSINVDIKQANGVLKIYSDKIIQNPYYCGHVPEQYWKDIYASSKAVVVERSQLFNALTCCEMVNGIYSKDYKDNAEEFASRKVLKEIMEGLS